MIELPDSLINIKMMFFKGYCFPREMFFDVYEYIDPIVKKQHVDETNYKYLFHYKNKLKFVTGCSLDEVYFMAFDEWLDELASFHYRPPHDGHGLIKWDDGKDGDRYIFRDFIKARLEEIGCVAINLDDTGIYERFSI